MNNDWIEINNTLQKTIELQNFKDALAFVNRVGDIAERLQHHPDICIKEYKKVFISTTTHDTGNTLTSKDYELVEAIDTLIRV